MTKYFYKLGHQAEISIAELAFLKTGINYEVCDDFVITDQYLDVNQTGSLVFAGEFLGGVRDSTEIKNLISDLPKKVGIIDLCGFKNVINELKLLGAKKVNLLNNLPTFGNFNHTDFWLIIFKFNKEIYFGKILSFFDQDFWANLDTDLPIKDMSRGLINLKLARTLGNLTTNENIYDPFCGFGRNLISNFDKKINFYGSDIKEDAKENLLFAERYFKQIKNYKLATLDAVNLDKFPYQVDWKKTSIVTEGSLGKNFINIPNNHDRQIEWQKIAKTWQKVLLKAKNLEIPEIVLCLPFYKIAKDQYLPEFYTDLLNNSELDNFYQFTKWSNNKNYLLYSRPNTIVGHFIVRIFRKEPNMKI